MRNKVKVFALSLMVGSLVAASSASAFSDIKDTADSKIAKALQAKGVIQGVSSDKFHPQGKLTTAQGVALIVKAMKLQSGPAAAEIPGVPKTAWYAEAASTAAEHDILSSGKISWNESLTREQFADLLYRAISATGDYQTIERLIFVPDNEEISEDKHGAIQFLLITKIAELNGKEEFQPQKTITRMEAAEMAYHAIEFVTRHQELNDNPAGGGNVESDAQVSVSKVNSEVNKVTITVDGLPNPGYSLAVEQIDFDGKQAVIKYRIQSPDPNKMYPQVISSSSETVYVDSQYEVIAKNIGENTVPTNPQNLTE